MSPERKAEIKQKNIVFDLTGVLFHPSQKYLLSEIGLLKLLWYALRHRQNPFNVFHKLLDFLTQVSPPTQKDKFYKGRILPACLCQAMVGEKSFSEILQDIEHVYKKLDTQNYFASKLERDMILAAARVIFNPDKIVERSLKPIKKGVTLLDAFHTKQDENGERAHNLFLLSNFDNDTFPALVKRYPLIFSRFSGMLISADVQSMKPDKEIYEKFFKRFNVKPQECYFIDDQPENVQAARILGMPGEVFSI